MGNKQGSYSKKDGEASKNGIRRQEWLYNRLSEKWNTHRRFPTHQADSGSTSRERVQNGHDTLERFGDPAIIPSKLAERSCLVLNHDCNGFD